MQGDEIKAARRSMGWTQAQMGEALGLSPNFVAMMERGEKAVERRTELAVETVLLGRLLELYEAGKIRSFEEDEAGEMNQDVSALRIIDIGRKMLERARKIVELSKTRI